MERVDKLYDMYLKVSEKEEKVGAVKELVSELVKAGFLTERAERKDIYFDGTTAAAVFELIDVSKVYRNKLEEIEKFLEYPDTRIVVTTEKPVFIDMPEVYIFEENRTFCQRALDLGFAVVEYYSCSEGDEAQESVKLVFLIKENYDAVAYLEVVKYLYEGKDC